MIRNDIMKPRFVKLRSCALPAALAVILVLLGCSKNTAQAAGPGGQSAQRPAAPVVVASVEQRDIPVQITAIGNVEAYQTVQIRSQVNGQLERVYFKEGDDVRKGQLLFQLDKAPFQAALEQAEGNLQRDQANAVNAQAQAARYTALEKQGVISREQAEQMRTQAQANASAVNADKAAVDAAKVQLRYTDIKAPIEARAGALLINVGNLIKANDTPYLVQLNQIAPIYATFSIPETQLQQVREYSRSGHLKVLAYPKGQTTDPGEGTLTFIDNGVDPTTGTVKLKGTFQNKDKRLWPGEYVDVVLDLSVRKNAIVVPTKAVQTGQQGTYVYIVTQDNTAKPQPVQTSGTFHDLTLIASGLAPRERVVVDGQLRIAPNGKVNVQSTVPTSASAPAAGGSQ
ncbi:MAG: efflux RND transporter periplasmic adaptor subunit [Acidobacteriia bacterium]|nr:efflux RND transporter periplasmic adaptor subunit [Terriglobia bacterium]